MILSLAGSCGDYCGKCPNYASACPGCLPELHSDCFFIRCIQTRRIEHCGLCAEFPCLALSRFCPDDSPGCDPGYHLENLRRRRAIGTETWLAEEKERWSYLRPGSC